MLPVSMMDFSVYRPPEEYKLNHDAGIVNAAKWSVSLSGSTTCSSPDTLLSALWGSECVANNWRHIAD